MTTMIARVGALAGAIGLSLAGCGSGASTTTTASGSSSAPVSLPGKVNQPKIGDATSGTLGLELDDFYFGPSFIKATPGSTVKLMLKNEGKNPHTFTSTALNVDQLLQPGASAEVTVTLPASGAVEFHCTFHLSQGMQGAFFSKPGDTVNGAAGAGNSSPATTGGYYN